MRPTRLEMEGFLAYRHHAVVDFEGADLFVLSGPTGAGKSSVIDAMIFALYGTIPRLDDRRVVEPVVSVRADRARVALTFEVEGETYQVARLVERRGSGASTTEARLQRGDDVLASGPAEVNEAITDLLGLGFDHFTRAVVLPQGAFARFLLDKPGEQQGLLRALLDLGIFSQVMQLANARVAAAKARAEVIGERLAKLEVPDEEQLESSRARLASLEEAMRELRERIGSLLSSRARLGELVGRVETLGQSLTLLESVQPPGSLDTWETERIEATQELERARGMLERLDSALADVNEDLAGRTELPTLRAWQEAGQHLAELERMQAGLDLAGLARAAAEAAAARDAARRHLADLDRAHAADQIRGLLRVGEPCPVCLVVVEKKVPDLEARPEGVDLAARVATLEEEADLVRDRLKEAEGEMRQLEARIGDAVAALRGAPNPAEIVTELAAVTALGERREQLARERAEAVSSVTHLLEKLHHLEERGGAFRDELVAARDRVAAEEPPRPGDDVVAAWKELLEWRDRSIRERRTQVERLDSEVTELRSEVAAAEKGLSVWLAGLGVEVTTSAETDLALTVERARAELIELEKTVEEASALEAELGEEERRRQVASELARHLRANNFESWIMEEALDVLVEGANRLLDELSAGTYSLLVRDRQFQVIDHLNAGAVRTTRGLSGGETFLVSLALALSMAEQLAELTGTTSRLESVFLDEGFGSLDQESLDLVATVLDELVGRGRMVGLVTHVGDLADRIPVRFEVSKGVESATVSKVVT